MELRFLEKNTPISIDVLNDDGSLYLSEPFRGNFYDADNNYLIFFTCDELHKRYNEFRKFPLQISFASKDNANTYDFTGKLAGEKTDIFGVKLLELNATSHLNKTSIRTSPRIDIPLTVNVYKLSDSGEEGGTGFLRTEHLFEGVSNDISSEGMGLLSDFELLPEHGTSFLAEISFKSSRKTQVPAVLKRTINNDKTVAFRYVYGFMFDFGEDLAKKNDLTIAIIQYITDTK